MTGEKGSEETGISGLAFIIADTSALTLTLTCTELRALAECARSAEACSPKFYVSPQSFAPTRLPYEMRAGGLNPHVQPSLWR